MMAEIANIADIMAQGQQQRTAQIGQLSQMGQFEQQRVAQERALGLQRERMAQEQRQQEWERKKVKSQMALEMLKIDPTEHAYNAVMEHLGPNGMGLIKLPPLESIDPTKREEFRIKTQNLGNKFLELAESYDAGKISSRAFQAKLAAIGAQAQSYKSTYATLPAPYTREMQSLISGIAEVEKPALESAKLEAESEKAGAKIPQPWDIFLSENIKAGKTPLQIVSDWNERNPGNLFIGLDAQGNPMFAKTRGKPEITTTPPPAGGPPVGKTIEPLPQAAQDNLSQGLSSLGTMSKLKKLIPATTSDVPVYSYLSGKVKKVGVAVGFGDESQDFTALKNQFKLSAQSLVKGTPSNFDVQTVIATMPSLDDSTSMANKKLEVAEDLIKKEVSRQIAYFKGTNKIIPKRIIDEAKSYKISIDEIKPNPSPWIGDAERGEPSQEHKLAPPKEGETHSAPDGRNFVYKNGQWHQVVK